MAQVNVVMIAVVLSGCGVFDGAATARRGILVMGFDGDPEIAALQEQKAMDICADAIIQFARRHADEALRLIHRAGVVHLETFDRLEGVGPGIFAIKVEPDRRAEEVGVADGSRKRHEHDVAGRAAVNWRRSARSRAC